MPTIESEPPDGIIVGAGGKLTVPREDIDAEGDGTGSTAQHANNEVLGEFGAVSPSSPSDASLPSLSSPPRSWRHIDAGRKAGKNLTEMIKKSCAEWVKEKGDSTAPAKVVNEGAQVAAVSPTESPTQIEKIADVDLPPTLRPGGLVESALDAHDKERARYISERIANDLTTIRRDYRRAAEGGGGSPLTYLASALAITFLSESSQDPVLRYCVACREGLETDRPDFETRAWRPYIEYKASYDAILCDLLPREFVDDADCHIAEVAYRFGTNATAHDDWPVFAAHLAGHPGDQLVSIKTGILELDALLGGGLRGLTILGGAPGQGKTSLAMAIAIEALKIDKDLAVLVLSFEMAKDSLLRRIFCREADVRWLDLINPDRPEEIHTRLREAEFRLRDGILGRLKIVEHISLPASGFTPAWLMEVREKLLAATNARHVLIVIDSFQRLGVPDVDDDLLADRVRLDAIKAIQDQTRSAICPEGDFFLVISKTRKEAGSVDLDIADLLGSSDLGSRASCVMFLERRKASETNLATKIAPVSIAIAKGRDGVDRSTVQLNFHYSTYRFESTRAAQNKPLKNGANPLGKSSRQSPPPYAGK